MRHDRNLPCGSVAAMHPPTRSNSAEARAHTRVCVSGRGRGLPQYVACDVACCMLKLAVHCNAAQRHTARVDAAEARPHVFWLFAAVGLRAGAGSLRQSRAWMETCRSAAWAFAPVASSASAVLWGTRGTHGYSRVLAVLTRTHACACGRSHAAPLRFQGGVRACANGAHMEKRDWIRDWGTGR